MRTIYDERKVARRGAWIAMWICFAFGATSFYCLAISEETLACFSGIWSVFARLEWDACTKRDSQLSAEIQELENNNG